MRPHLFLGAAALLALTACTSIDVDREPAADFPKLEERIVYGFWATQQCAGTVPPVTIAYGCAWLDFARRTCTIFLASESASSDTLLHERQHCRGFDHHGSTAIADRWALWRAWLQRVASEAGAGAR